MREDSWLIAIVFVVWAALSILYYTIPMIYMPAIARVWGLGALLFLVLAVVVAIGEGKGRTKHHVDDPPTFS